MDWHRKWIKRHPPYGQILLNGVEIAPEHRDDYRQLFSAIFFDFYLFDDLMIHDGADMSVINSYLEAGDFT